MEVLLFERVAGLDVGKASLTVCVRTPGARRGRHSERRTFKTTMGLSLVMRGWLVQEGATVAAARFRTAKVDPCSMARLS